MIASIRVKTPEVHVGETAMASPAMFAEIASLAGDPSRAAMLHALMDGRALTA